MNYEVHFLGASELTADYANKIYRIRAISLQAGGNTVPVAQKRQRLARRPRHEIKRFFPGNRKLETISELETLFSNQCITTIAK